MPLDLRPMGRGADRIHFLDRLAEALDAGLAAMQAFELSHPPVSSSAISRSLERLRQGDSLALALADLEIFSSAELAVFEAAECAGRMSRALRQRARAREEARERSRRLVARLLYPLFLLHLVPIVLFAPRVVSHGFGSALLPVLASWIVVWAVIAALFALAHNLEASPRLARAALSLPRLGEYLRLRSLNQYFEILSGMYAAGVPIASAHSLAAKSVPHHHVRAALESATGRIERGSSLSEALAIAGIFRSIELDWIRTAETTGSLETSLLQMGDWTSSEMRDELAVIARWTTAIVYGFAIIVVSWVVLSFWLSYYGNLMKSLR